MHGSIAIFSLRTLLVVPFGGLHETAILDQTSCLGRLVQRPVQDALSYALRLLCLPKLHLIDDHKSLS